MKLLGEELMAGDWEKRDVMGRGLKNVRLSREGGGGLGWRDGIWLSIYLAGKRRGGEERVEGTGVEGKGKREGVRG